MQNKHSLRDEEKKLAKGIGERRKTFQEKYPLLFALGGAFGLVSTFYGFEKLIDRVDLFTEHPWILLGTGIITLAITGTFYNKLS
jgi:hypothetical protein